MIEIRRHCLSEDTLIYCLLFKLRWWHTLSYVLEERVTQPLKPCSFPLQHGTGLALEHFGIEGTQHRHIVQGCDSGDGGVRELWVESMRTKVDNHGTVEGGTLGTVHSAGVRNTQGKSRAFHRHSKDVVDFCFGQNRNHIGHPQTWRWC